LNDDWIASYTVLFDVRGEPAVILRAINERDIYQHGLASRTLYTGLLIVFAGTMTLAIGLLVWQMQAQGQELSDILNGSADPIVLTDANGTILKTNTSFEAVCGPGHRSLLDIVCPEHPEYRQTLQEKLQQTVAWQTTQTLAEIPFRCQSLGRDRADFEVTLVPVRSRFKRSPRLIVTLHDLALQKQMEAHLRSALNREMEINRLKTQFLSVASHEFRTPLAVIQSSADLLDHYWNRQTDGERRERLVQIKKAVATMRQLTDDLLLHVRTETGALEVHPEPLDINALCQRVVSEMTLTQDKAVPVILHPAPTPRPVQADLNLMTLVLRNLLSNAIKYSPNGKTVSLSVDQSNSHTVLTVHDDGIGIPLNEQPHLFTPFFRASNVGRIAGTGLGLSIVRRAVELQGGAITFESAPGQGTTFRVTLPHEVPTTPVAEAQPQHPAEVEMVR
jgi:PAS domain S-box-containing protein